MASLTIEEAIITIAVVAAASTLMVAVFSGLSRMEASYHSLIQDTTARINTAIKIIYCANTSTTQIKLWVKNIGSEKILLNTLNKSDIILKGPDTLTRLSPNAASDGWTYQVVNGDQDQYWDPGETLEVTVVLSTTLTKGDYQITITLYNGATATYDFST